jgi:saccharopine dehydrogenase-like NADP-dependent oxidoreductase
MTPDARTPTVHVLGGAGYFGGLLVEDLLATTNARVHVAGRSAARLTRLARDLAHAGARLTTGVLDARDRERLAATVRAGDIVVDCAGPFQTRGTEVVDTAVRAGAHYVDIADARNHQAAIAARRNEWARAGTTVLAGASAVPALVVLLARRAATSLQRVDAIRTWMAPGNREPRRYGTVYSLLDGLGEPFSALQDGRLATVQPWSGRAVASFPAPVGRRSGYRMSGVDSDVLPTYFPTVRTCELRVGAELGVLNAAVALLQPLAQIAPRLFRRTAPMLRLSMAAFGWLGSSAGGMLVRVDGERDGRPHTVESWITCAHRAPRIAIVPTSIAIAKILDGTMLPRGGWTPLDTWLTHDELVANFRARGCEVGERHIGSA